MKFFYTFLGIILLGVVAIAQNNSKTLAPDFSNVHLMTSQTPLVKHRTPKSPSTPGDTVFVFDGYNSYDWNGTLPATFNLKLEDIDSYTVDPTLQASFGVKGSFSFFYELDPTTTIDYDHPDSVFYAAATSYFKPPGKANNWLEMGPIKVPANGGTLKWRHNVQDGKFRDGYEILINTAGLGYANFTGTPLVSFTDNDPITVGDTVNFPHSKYVQYSANVSAYAGKNIYIAVHHNGNDQFLLRITDIILLEGFSSGINENNSIISSLQNMPNPASNNTVISYSLKESANVELSLFDIAGKKLASLTKGNQSAGNHQYKFDVSNLSSGIYFYTISSGGYEMKNKMSVVK